MDQRLDDVFDHGAAPPGHGLGLDHDVDPGVGHGFFHAHPGLEPEPPPRVVDRLAMRRGLDEAPLLSFSWRDVVFEHYRVTDELAVRRWLPAGLELDHHDGDAYVSVVSARIVGARLGNRMPLLGARTFRMVCVRTYVRSGDRFGVFVMRKWVSSVFGAPAARLLYAMPTETQTIHFASAGAGDVEYVADLPTGQVHCVAGRIIERLCGHELDPSKRRFFLIERYQQFSRVDAASRVVEATIGHTPWELYRLGVRDRTHAAMVAVGLFDSVEPLGEVHTSPGVDAVMWRPYELGQTPPLAAYRRWAA